MGKVRSVASGPSVASEGGAQERRGGKTLRLSVASFTKRVRRTQEKNFEPKFYKALEKAGYANWHMSCRDAGWPDRYAVGGRWFELKSLNELGKNSELREGQVRHLNMLTKGGDKCFYVAKWERGVIFLPWTTFRDACSERPDVAVAKGHRYAYNAENDLLEAIRYVVG